MNFLIKCLDGVKEGWGPITFGGNGIYFQDPTEIKELYVQYDHLLAFYFKDKVAIFQPPSRELGGTPPPYITEFGETFIVKDGILLNFNSDFEYEIPLKSIDVIESFIGFPTRQAVQIFNKWPEIETFYYIRIPSTDYSSGLFRTFINYDDACKEPDVHPEDIGIYYREYIPSIIKSES